MGILHRFNRYVTVEIITVFFSFTLPMTQVAIQDLLYLKICLQTTNTTELLCRDQQFISTHKEIEGQTSLWSMYLNIATILPAIVTAILLGSYIDKYGFGLPIKLALIGTFISCAVATIVSMTSVRHEFLIIGMLVMGICGHSPTILMAANAYVIMDSNEKDKTFRIAVVGSSLAIAVTIGLAIMGPLTDNLGVQWVFIFGMISIAIAFIDSLLRLRPAKNQPMEVHEKPSKKFKEIFEIKTMTSYIRVMTRKRERSKRLHLHLMTIVFVLSFCALIGVVDVEFLYLTKEKGFSITSVSIFMSVATLLTFLGNIIGTYVLSNKLDLHLTWITLIGSIGAIINYAGFSLSNSITVLWIFNVFKTFSGLTSVAARSYVSGCVEPNEHGTIMSFMAVVEALFKLIATLAFNGLYPLTLASWPGMLLMVAAILCACGIPLLGYIRWHEWRAERNYYRVLNTRIRVEHDDNSDDHECLFNSEQYLISSHRNEITT